jgi:hypothetical protein
MRSSTLKAVTRILDENSERKSAAGYDNRRIKNRPEKKE